MATVGFHLGVTTIIYLAGKTALFPQLIDPNAVVIADNQIYHPQVVLLAGILTG